MIQVTNKNRDTVIEDYVNFLVDNMDCDSVVVLLKELLDEKYDLMTNLALEGMIQEHCPEILSQT